MTRCKNRALTSESMLRQEVDADGLATENWYLIDSDEQLMTVRLAGAKRITEYNGIYSDQTSSDIETSSSWDEIYLAPDADKIAKQLNLTKDTYDS